MAKPVAGPKLIAENRRARHDYELLERVEAGIVLTGTEVKSLRDGHVQLGQAYADVRDGEAWLIGASIAEYAQGNRAQPRPDRDRKLLLHRGEIDSLYGKVREKGLTLVPTRLYFKDGRSRSRSRSARGKEQGRQAARRSPSATRSGRSSARCDAALALRRPGVAEGRQPAGDVPASPARSLSPARRALVSTIAPGSTT